MEKLKTAVIGLGGVAQIMHLPHLIKMKDVEISAICDIDFSKAKFIGRKYNIKKVYKDIELLLKENDDLKTAVISVPTDMHSSIALKCFDAGLNVFVEKPVARNYEETLKMVKTAVDNDCLFMVGMNNRFRADTMLQRSFIKASEIGELFYIKTGWLKTQSSNTRWFLEREKAGGGVFLDNGIVMLDLGLWMFDFPEIASVSALNYYHKSKSVEDSNFTFVRFRNGSALTIEVSWSFLRKKEFYYCDVYGKLGSSSINPLKIFKKISNDILEVTPKTSKIQKNMNKDSFEFQMKHFIGAVKGMHKLVSSGKDALKVMQIADAVYKSDISGKEVLFS
ncbi:MAG: Gfo/Idh/MocA family oxidoreductase [Ignavibacteria bacterium]|nr:Gfo/Idh/MocA family oxidoreductase [Ignavibacteria bacterium]